ncbi:PREDICTED: zinc finger CCCH domain-containing protein 18-like [Camelina sativa]|uniref:Zinc finger CCCH domain-containing protein 18-like n=1 Tax=Camelina sativa TaxID=90675 RepID=A0ABM1RMR4_CAMSA|nr:PREDICTED: zinc finger CCCH domain-containing protein 18-like [Camelina sativa]
MNFTEAMNVVHNRIHELEPENASKIIGYLLLIQDHNDRDMIRLAFCPDSVMRSMINCVKYELAKNSHYNVPSSDHIQIRKFGSFTGSSNQSLLVFVSPPSVLSMGTSSWENTNDMDSSLQNNVQFLNFEDSSINSPEFSTSFFSQEKRQGLCLRTTRRSPSLPEFPVKICHYFNKGFCKHGNNCRYFHGQIKPERDSFSQMFNPNNNLSDDEHVVSSCSLEKLEGEIIELLKSRRGAPISIASLTMMYYEKYGRTLQAEGYLTESQRHGKAGYSLTKLLARLKNTIRLIDRPHGQHSVVLAEDVSKFVEYEQGAILAGSRQIYLTFPAESSFNEYDVSNYFSKFGPVEDVRMPYQQKRMFGFVTFAYTETAKHILAKGNPHFICGARVLVKPYREKSCSSRYIDNNKPLLDIRYGSRYIDKDTEMNTMPMRVSESSRLVKKQFLEEHKQSVSRSLPSDYSYLGFSSNDFKLTTDEEEQEEQAGRLSYLLDYLNTEDNIMNTCTTYKDNDRRIHCEALDSQDLNLPDSPFSSLFGKEISLAT